MSEPSFLLVIRIIEPLRGSNMTDNQRKKHKTVHASSSDRPEHQYSELASGSSSSNIGASQSIQPMTRSLQELTDLHHSEAGSMHVEYAIDHVQTDSADHPADPNQDDQFIPHE